jgi:flagellar protein FlbD
MITLHRLGHTVAPFQLNPDLIVSIESTPDTVITLATSAKVVVSDTPEQVRDAVKRWRAQVLSAALHDRSEQVKEDAATAAPIRALSRGPALAAIGGGAH